MNRPFAMLSLTLLTLVGSAEASGSRRGPRPSGHPHQWFHVSAAPLPKEVRGDLCATNERAEKDAYKKLNIEVKTWLAEAGVNPSWNPPQKLVSRMVIGQAVYEPVKVEDLEVIRATITADFSETRKREFLEIYKRQAGARHVILFGGGLAVLLVSLAAVSGYIRADEATKGYYTKRLQLLAAAGVGAAGVVVYRVLT